MEHNVPSEALRDVSDEPKSIAVAVDASAIAPAVVSMATRISRSMPTATVHVIHVFRTSRLDRARVGAPPTNTEMIEEAKDHLAYHVRTLQRGSRANVIG